MDLLTPPEPALVRAQTNPEQHLHSPPLSTTTSVDDNNNNNVTTRPPYHRRARSVPGNELRQVITAHFIDDYGAHHYNPDHHSVHDGEDHEDEPTSPLSVNDEEKQNVKLDRQPTDTSFPSSTTTTTTTPDLERGRSHTTRPLTREKSRRSQRSQSKRDPFLVRFSENDPANPKTWSFKRRWAATALVSVFTFLSPTSSSMSAPAVTQIGDDLGVHGETELSLLISIFVLAYAIGPLFLGPLSEIYGRRIVLQSSNLFFLAFNLGCGFAQTSGQLIAFRFLSGLGGSAPLAIGGGVLGDCWDAEHRGQAVGLYSLMPLLGPAIGPVAGGWIAQKTTWRWCFWSTSILTVLVQVLGLLFLKETFGPVILGWRAKKLRKETGDQRYHTEWEKAGEVRKLGKVLKVSLLRPARLLVSQPIIQALAVYMAFIYGLMYLVLTTFPTVWEGTYGESPGIGGLNYLSLGIGFFLGAQTVSRINDVIYRKLKAKNNGVGRPEFRAPMILPGAILIPSGMLIYGWSAHYVVHWIVPNIGAAMFAAGTIATFQCTQTYLVDTYSTFAASAVAAVTVLRSLAGFGFPLFARQMYAALGLGWGNTLLALVAIVLGGPAPFVLWKYGEALRNRSQFAKG